MYSPGKLIYFDPFYFKSGDHSKPKYFLVLKVVDGGTVVLVSLPSSKRHIPANIPIVHGCLEKPEVGLNCYVFQAHHPITKDGWSFGLDTMLYGIYLDDYLISTLNATYSVPGIDYEVIGKLTDYELAKVVNCFA